MLKVFFSCVFSEFIKKAKIFIRGDEKLPSALKKKGDIMKLIYLSIMVIGFVVTGYSSANNLDEQEALLESQLEQATNAEQVVKISMALSTVKKQQTLNEYNKLPESMGRDRSIVNSSIREDITYRQMASSFKSAPESSSVASSYIVTRFMSYCCVIMGCFFLLIRLRFRY